MVEINLKNGKTKKAKRGILRSIRFRFGNEKGQSTMEYILIIALVALVATKFKEKFNTKMQEMTQGMNDKMDEAMK